MKRLCFIHVPKTAGTYVRGVFSGHPRYFNDGMHGFAGVNPKGHKDHSKYLNMNRNRNYLHHNNFRYLNFFTVVRNPFDLLYSYYCHSRNNYSGWMACNTIHDIQSFEEFIDKYCDPDFVWHLRVLKKFLFIQLFMPNGRCVPKHVVRYEKLNEGLRIVARDNRMNIDSKISEKKVNASPKKKGYKDAYSESMKDKVYKKCRLELEMFGYDFDGPLDDKALVSTRKLNYKWRP